MNEQEALALLAEELKVNQKSREAFQESPRAFLTGFLSKHQELGELSDDALEGVAGGFSFNLTDFASRLATSATFDKEFVSRINAKQQVMW
jgi:hypothetical protein